MTRINENALAGLDNLTSLDLPDNPSLYIDTNAIFNNPKLLEKSITCGGETCSQEMQNKLKNFSLGKEKFLITPSLPKNAEMLSFSRMPDFVKAGYNSTIAVMPKLKQLFS